MAKRHLEQYDKNGASLPIYINDDEVMVGGKNGVPLGEKLSEIEEKAENGLVNSVTLNGVKKTPNSETGDVDLGVVYVKPTSGIPESDFDSEVQTRLGMIDDSVRGIKVGSLNAIIRPNNGVVTIPVDAAFSPVSSNPIQNRAVYAEIDNLRKAINAMSGEDISSAIETLQEVLDFLDGITDEETLVGKLNVLQQSIGTKLSTDSDIILQLINASASAYYKPNGGIPKTDLASAVQASLGKADSALQGVKDSSGNLLPVTNNTVTLPASQGSSAQRTLINMDDSDGLSFTDANGDAMTHAQVIALLNDEDINVVLHYAVPYEVNSRQFTENCYLLMTSKYVEEGETPAYYFECAKGASSGLFFEVTLVVYDGEVIIDETMFALLQEQIQADWNQSNTSAKDYIKNKPTIPNVSGLATKSEVATGLATKQDKLTFDNAPTQNSNNPVKSGGVYTALAGKQATLVSGTNIKTVNNTSLLGSGNISIPAGADGKSAYQSYLDTTSDSPVKTEAEWVASLHGDDGISVDSDEVVVVHNLDGNPDNLQPGQVATLGADMGKELDEKFSPVAASAGDFEIADEAGNVILRLADGHIQTKEFDSSQLDGGSQTKSLKIFFVGNSFSMDAAAYAPFIISAMNAGIQLTIGCSYVGGCSLQTHLGYLTNDTAAYAYYKSVNGGAWSSASSQKMSTMLADEAWDVVVLQQNSDNAGDYDTIGGTNDYLGGCITQIVTRLGRTPKFWWLLTQRKTSVAYTYDTMLSIAQRVALEYPIGQVIPVGAAVELARGTTLDALGSSSHLQADNNGHLQEGLPVLLAGYSLVMTILHELGIDGTVIGNSYTFSASPTPSVQQNGSVIGMTDANRRIAQHCAVVADNNNDYKF